MNLIVLIDKLLINLCIEYKYVLLLQLTERKITLFLSVGILEHSPLPIEKKANATECGDFRTISLIPHASKIVLKILTKRITTKAEEFLGKNQFVFRKGCGTRGAIGVMRMLCERSL